MAAERAVYQTEVAGLKRRFPLFEVAPGVRIAIVNILGDVELVQAAATVLTERLKPIHADVFVTAEAKSIPLIHVLAAQTGTPYVVLRKAYKPYMGAALSAETLSITTGALQTLYLDDKDRVLLAGRNVALIDDVISTGSTLQAMRALVEKAGGTISAEAAIFTEGDAAKWSNVIALGHLPVFSDTNDAVHS